MFSYCAKCTCNTWKKESLCIHLIEVTFKQAGAIFSHNPSIPPLSPFHVFSSATVIWSCHKQILLTDLSKCQVPSSGMLASKKKNPGPWITFVRVWAHMHIYGHLAFTPRTAAGVGRGPKEPVMWHYIVWHNIHTGLFLKWITAFHLGRRWIFESSFVRAGKDNNVSSFLSNTAWTCCALC